MAWDFIKKVFKKGESETAQPAAGGDAPKAAVKEPKGKMELTEEQLESELAKLPAPIRSQLDNPEIKKKIVTLAKKMSEAGVNLKSMKQVKAWIKDNPDAVNDGGAPEKVATFRREEPRVGRNDACPCGSGKKYKKCCGK
ncbi:MAG: SEC-C metal-binding domain-containing protein [Elusimicrobiaceae bacterium]|jgi:preprotein translocase subunit SecA